MEDIGTEDHLHIYLFFLSLKIAGVHIKVFSNICSKNIISLV